MMASDLLWRRKEMPVFCPGHICIVLSLISTKLARKKLNVGIRLIHGSRFFNQKITNNIE